MKKNFEAINTNYVLQLLLISSILVNFRIYFLVNSFQETYFCSIWDMVFFLIDIVNDRLITVNEYTHFQKNVKQCLVLFIYVLIHYQCNYLSINNKSR